MADEMIETLDPGWREVARLQREGCFLSATAAAGQEGALDALLGTATPDRAPDPFVARLAFDTARRRERKRSACVRLAVRDGYADRIHAPQPDPVLAAVNRDALARATGALPTADALIVIRLADGETSVEVGMSVGVEAATLRQRAARARARMRCALGA